jgi:HD-GYP domain-containing protein (c-di-GMP phosphodiesterase class II)
MAEGSITERAEEYVLRYLKNNLSPAFTFHTFGHASDVVIAARDIGKGCGLSEEEIEIVELAAWFHDVGYAIDKQDHEEHSWQVAKEFLAEENYPEDKQQEVHKCIMATRLDYEGASTLECVIADADLSHLGIESHASKSELLRQELKSACNIDFTDVKWIEHDIAFLLKHTYNTVYAQKKYHNQKVENLLSMQKRLAKLQEKKVKKKAQKDSEKLKREVLALKNEKYRTSDRGVQTMFRVTLRNHIQLSAIADNKANIMLSINAILISIIVSGVGPKILTKYWHLALPVLMMILTSIITILLAVKSTRPKITSGKFTEEDITLKRANLLFFGNFHNMALEDFERGFQAMINDKDFLYDSLSKDFYYLGQVLGKKYSYLSKCYTVFAGGYVVSIIALIISVAIRYYE